MEQTVSRLCTDAVCSMAKEEVQGGTVYWCVGALCWTEMINASGGSRVHSAFSKRQNKRLAQSAKIINTSLYVKYAINLTN